MPSKLKAILFIFLFALLWLPLFQEFTKWFKEPELKGVFVKPAIPQFSIDSLKSTGFQKKLEDFENYNFGFRALFVKTKNSLNHILFNELSINNNIEGKNGFIFQKESTEQTLGISYGPKEKYQIALEQIKCMKEGIEKHGGHFLAVIAPSKEKVMPDFLPHPYLGKYKAPNEYTDFIEGYKKNNIPFIDFCPYFNKLIDTCQYPLFNKTGYHWSMYGAAFAQDSLLRYIETSLATPLPKYKRTGIEFSDSARWSDADFEGPLNLFYSLSEPKYVYPKFEMITSTKKNKKPKVIIIGDSFFWQIKHQKMLQHVFSADSRFWFYFSFNSYRLSDAKGIPLLKGADVMEELESADYVILLCNVSTLDYFPYGAADFYCKNMNTPRMTSIIENYINNNCSWLEKLTQKKEAKTMPFDELTKAEAKQIRNERTVFNLLAANQKYVCADGAAPNLVFANRDNISTWETFTLFHLQNDTIAICSDEGKFLSAELAANTEITANRKNIGPWEIFTLVKIDKNFVAFKACNGKYLSLNEKTQQLFATANAIGKKERFKFVILK